MQNLDIAHAFGSYREKQIELREAQRAMAFTMERLIDAIIHDGTIDPMAVLSVRVNALERILRNRK